MKIFISWSGERSRQTAEALKQWLKLVIQTLEPWISMDMKKGKRWSPEIAGQLETAKMGIICLNSGNLEEPWILFEAGALAKIVQSNVCTFLLDIQPTDVKEPLSQFQHTIFEKEDIWKLVSDINNVAKDTGATSLDDETLRKTFNTFWPELEERLKKIISSIHVPKKITRKDREILEEVLEVVRRIEKSPQKGTMRTFYTMDRNNDVHALMNDNSTSLKTRVISSQIPEMGTVTFSGTVNPAACYCSVCQAAYLPRAIGENGICPNCNSMGVVAAALTPENMNKK